MSVHFKPTRTPTPRNRPMPKRIAAIFYNRRADGSIYGETEYHFPRRMSIAALNSEAVWYQRDHFAVWSDHGDLLHDGPTLNALGAPVETYAARAHTQSTAGMAL